MVLELKIGDEFDIVNFKGGVLSVRVLNKEVSNFEYYMGLVYYNDEEVGRYALLINHPLIAKYVQGDNAELTSLYFNKQSTVPDKFVYDNTRKGYGTETINFFCNYFKDRGFNNLLLMNVMPRNFEVFEKKIFPRLLEKESISFFKPIPDIRQGALIFKNNYQLKLKSSGV